MGSQDWENGSDNQNELQSSFLPPKGGAVNVNRWGQVKGRPWSGLKKAIYPFPGFLPSSQGWPTLYTVDSRQERE